MNTMNVQQIVEQMLSFSLQQHAIKDQTIAGLQGKNAELLKTLEKYEPQQTQDAKQ